MNQNVDTAILFERRNMKFWIFITISLFFALGYCQEEAVSTTPPPDGWGIQGNVRWTRAQTDAELNKAALAARQKKALMESMASVSAKPPTATNAEEYLQVHGAPKRVDGESAPSPVRRDTYVPEFEAAPARKGSGEASAQSVSATPARSAAPTTPAFETPKKSKFSWFGKKSSAPASGDASSAVVNPAATKDSFWRRLTGQGKAAEASIVAEPASSTTHPMEVAADVVDAAAEEAMTPPAAASVAPTATAAARVAAPEPPKE